MERIEVKIEIGDSGFDYEHTLYYTDSISDIQKYAYTFGIIYCSDRCYVVDGIYAADCQGIDVCGKCYEMIDPLWDGSEETGICERCYHSEICDRCQQPDWGGQRGREFRGRENGKFKVYCPDCNGYLLASSMRH